MLASIAGPDSLIIIAVVLLLFGSTQVPKLARSLGSASREFKRGQDEGHGVEHVHHGIAPTTGERSQPGPTASVSPGPVTVVSSSHDPAPR